MSINSLSDHAANQYVYIVCSVVKGRGKEVNKARTKAREMIRLKLFNLRTPSELDYQLADAINLQQ